MSGTEAQTEALVTGLLERAESLTRAVLATMYRDPFWHARFGARADEHGRKDGHFHLSYLAQALRADDPEVMVHYARWLRTVLVSRGMCTRHLQDNLRLLAREVEGLALPGGERAVAMLERAADGLRYGSGTAARLQEEEGALAVRCVDALRARGRSDLEARGHAWRGSEDEARYLVDYAADALASARPELLGDYLRFLRGLHASQPVAGAPLDLTLEALHAALVEAGHEEAAALWDAARR